MADEAKAAPPAAPPAPVVPATTPTILKGLEKKYTAELPPGFTVKAITVGEDPEFEASLIQGDGIKLELLESESKTPFTLANLKEGLAYAGKVKVVKEVDEADHWVLIHRDGKHTKVEIHAKTVKITCSGEDLDGAKLDTAIAICRSITPA